MECPICNGEMRKIKTKEHIHLGQVDYYYTFKCIECGFIISTMNSEPIVDSYTIIDQEYDYLAGTGSACLCTNYDNMGNE